MKKKCYVQMLAFFLLLGCSKNEVVDPEPVPEDTQIATFIRLDFVPVDAGTPAYIEIAYDKKAGTYSSSGNNLRQNKTYLVSLTLEDRRLNPVKDIKSMLSAQADNYQIFYSVSDTSKLSFAYSDADSKALPIGISTKATTGTGTSFPLLNITIKHVPVKKDGNITTGTTVFEASKSLSIL